MSFEAATYSAILGQVFAQIRKQKGIEQGEMAARMGVTQASYSRLEGGKATFSVDQMYQAANALDISVSDVIEKLERFSSELQQEGIDVQPQLRSNTTKAAQSNGSDSGVAKVIAGAALGALLLGILSKK